MLEHTCVPLFTMRVITAIQTDLFVESMWRSEDVLLQGFEASGTESVESASYLLERSEAIYNWYDLCTRGRSRWTQ